MKIKEDSPYIGIKVRGLPHFVWFEEGKFSSDGIFFYGHEGWGKDGAPTDIECRIVEINSVIHSDSPQY